MADLMQRVRDSWRILLKEVSAFGAIGIIGIVIQLGLFNLLHDIGALKANTVAMVAATTFAYFGNRYLSFSHRARTGLKREAAWFFGINAVTYVVAQLILLIAYVIGQQQDRLVTTVLNLVGIGVGTIIRFWAYKRFVFLHPDRVNVTTGEIDADDVPVVRSPRA